MGKYSKLITAVVSGLIGWGVLVVNSKSAAITASEWITGATYLAAAFGVYVVPNQG